MFLEKGLASPRDPADCKQCQLHTLVLYQRLNIAYFRERAFMPRERTSACVDVCPEATPRDSWGGRASVSASPSPRQGAGPGGGSHIGGGGGARKKAFTWEGPGPIWRQWEKVMCTELLTRGPRATPRLPSNGVKNPTCMCDFAMEKSHSFHQIFEEVPF